MDIRHHSFVALSHKGGLTMLLVRRKPRLQVQSTLEDSGSVSRPLSRHNYTLQMELRGIGCSTSSPSKVAWWYCSTVPKFCTQCCWLNMLHFLKERTGMDKMTHHYSMTSCICTYWFIDTWAWNPWKPPKACKASGHCSNWEHCQSAVVSVRSIASVTRHVYWRHVSSFWRVGEHSSLWHSKLRTI